MRTLANVSERDRLTYDFDESFVNDFAKVLSQKTGLDWRGVHKGHANAIPEAAVFNALRQDENGRWVLAGVMVLADIRPDGPGDAVTAEMLRKVSVTAMENSANLTGVDELIHGQLDELPRLERADRGPEEFSRIVAEHYKVWAQYVTHPVAAMAAEAKVKPATMHTWVREARLRGFLPPARRGKGR